MASISRDAVKQFSFDMDSLNSTAVPAASGQLRDGQRYRSTP